MEPHARETRNLERQITLARPVLLVLALLDLLKQQDTPVSSLALSILAAYLALGVVLAVLEFLERGPELHLPFAVDLAALVALLAVIPTVNSFWFVFLFVAFAAGIRWDLRLTLLFSGLVAVGLLVRTIWRESQHFASVVAWAGLLIGTFAAGAGVGLLGSLQKRRAAEHEFLARLGNMIRVEHGMAESLRQVLSEILRVFGCEQAVIAVVDEDVERLFVWRAKRSETGRLSPESLPLEKSDAFLLDALDSSVCWNQLEGRGEGFAWNRKDGKPLAEIPRLPGPSRQELGARSLLAVTLEYREYPTGRLLLINGDNAFSKADLSWLERVARSLGPALENLYSLRHLRAKAIESERTRIAHDLHDGILQTLLSFNIQLDVLRRKLPQAPDRVANELAALQQTLRHESEELRRMVTEMRPLHVISADLVDLMNGFADRFRQESNVALDLIVDSLNLQVPDRTCREIFQIYREALHNVKKHAHATHVVVKLWQDEDKVTLVVDDNGQGFSFAGRFSSDELDRLRLGPISIKERTRSIGGLLTVESNPGHGARVTVEVPVS